MSIITTKNLGYKFVFSHKTIFDNSVIYKTIHVNTVSIPGDKNTYLSISADSDILLSQEDIQILINDSLSQYQPLNSNLTSISSLSGSSGFLKTDGTLWFIDNTSYLTGNQTISVTGDVSGSGTTSIPLTLATVNTNVGTYGSSTTVPIITVNGKGLITTVTTGSITPFDIGAQASSTNLTSLSGLTYNSTSFVKMTAVGTFSLDTNTYLTSSNAWGIAGNSGTTGSTNFIGTTDAKTVSIKANNNLGIYVYTDGRVSIGSTSLAPAPLTISSTQSNSTSYGTYVSTTVNNAGGTGYGIYSTYGTSGASQNYAIYGNASNTTSSPITLYGVYGIGTAGSDSVAYGVYGIGSGGTSYGVYGTGVSYGIYANSVSGIPLYANTTSGTYIAQFAKSKSVVAYITSNGIVYSINSLNGYTTTATVAGTTTLSNTSTYFQYFTGTTTQTVKLPLVTTLILGTSYAIINNSTGTITLQSNGAAVIVTIPAGWWAEPTCINIGTDGAAAWSYTLQPNVFSGSGSGTVTSVSGTGIVSGLTLTGTVTGSGSLTLGGTISNLTTSNLSTTAGILNSQLANSSITIQGSTTSLGGSINIINGTGFVKASGTTISYDNSTYLTTSSAASTYLPSSNISGTSGYISSFTGGNSLGNSPIYTDGTNVGVGITNPADKLVVSGAVVATGFVNYNTGETGAVLDYYDGNARIFGQNSSGGSTGLYFFTTNSGSIVNPLVLKSDGNVGIGTTSPSNPLDVRYPYAKTDATRRGVVSFYSNDTSNAHGLVITSIGAASQANRTVSLQTQEQNTSNAGNLVLQDSGGNVGIGTTSPDSTFTNNGSTHLMGDTKIDGNLTAANLNLTSLSSGSSTDSVLTIDESGNVRKKNAISLSSSSGTYVPTNVYDTTANSNISSIHFGIAHYIRVGNEVHVKGRAVVVFTTSGSYSFSISLPVSSLFTIQNDLNGDGSSGNSNTTISIDGSSGNYAFVFGSAVVTPSSYIDYDFIYTVK